MAGNFLDWLRAVQRSNVAAAPPPDTPDLPALADPSSTSIFGVDGASGPVPANLFSADPSPHPDLMAPTSTLSPNGVRTAIAPDPASDPQASVATAPAKTGLFGLHWNQDYSPAQRWQILGATLRDAGLNFSGDGKDADSLSSLLKSVETQNEKLDTRHRLAQLAKAQFPDDPVRQALFAADPTPYISANAEATKTKLPVVVSEGGQVIDPMTGRLIASNPRAERPIIVPEGGTVMDRAPAASGGVPSSPYAPPSAPTATAPAPAGPTQPLDPHAFFRDFVMPHEGGLNPHDANGSPTNFGINQAANPDVDVTKLTPAAASDIFASKYFTPSGAASLPPALAAVHADTSFINPKRAQQFLAESDGDPAKYMALRGAWMDNLVQSEPDKYGKYANAWNNRNRDLAAYSAKLGDAPSSPTATPAPPPTPGSLVPIYTAPGRPAGHASTTAELTAAGLPKGTAAWTDANGKPTPYSQEFQPTPARDTSLTGDDFLKTLPQGYAARIKAYANGDLALPTGNRGGRAQQQVLDDVFQFDPTASAANLTSRQSTRKSFTSGPYSQTVNAANTALGHMDNLDRAIDQLHNGGFGAWNKLAQGAGVAFGNSDTQKAVANFNTYKTMVANELTKVYRGTNGAEADIKSWQEQLDSASSPAQLHAVVHAMAEGLDSRLEALNLSYQQGMGRTTDPMQFLTPHAKATFDRLKGDAPADTTPIAPAAAAPQFALPPVSERKVGMVIDSPRGKAMWNGHGWVLQ